MDNELITKQNNALNVLVEAARLAQSRGAFTLEQAALVADAIRVFKQDEKTPDLSENVVEPAAPADAVNS